MLFDPGRPFDPPPLPPTQDVETPAVLKAVLRASRRLATLNAACLRVPDPTLLINLTPIIEAQASSEIENIVTTNDELFRAARGALEAPSPSVKEALRYRTALRVGFDVMSTRPLGFSTALAVGEQLMGAEVQVRSMPGTFIGNPATGERSYTPPQGKENILNHLRQWEQFLHDYEPYDPLVALAMQHYQFEAIHPFYDGNGRTGRILNLLCLNHFGLLDLPVLSLSGYILRHKSAYYRLLREVTERAAWQEWVLFFMDAVEVTASSSLELIDAVLTTRDELDEAIRERHSKMPAADLARLLTRQPYCRIEDVVNVGLAQRQTASRWLSMLAEEGMLRREQIGRSIIFSNPVLLARLFENQLVGS